MTAISAATGPTAIQGQATEPKNAEAKFADDYQSFLKLLVTQLQNQDPMQPMDANQFMSQLATMTEVEQSITANTTLSEIRDSLDYNSYKNDMAFMGVNVEAATNKVKLSDGKANFAYTLDGQAKKVAVFITDEKGATVRSFDAPTEFGRHNITWDGIDDFGNSAPADGDYKVSIMAIDKAGEEVAASVTSSSSVKEVLRKDGDTILRLMNGAEISPADVLRAWKPTEQAAQSPA